MRKYLNLLSKIMTDGDVVQTGATLRSDGRQPTARSLFGEQLCFDLAEGFPAVTTKALWWKGVVAEWIWFMRGTGDITYLREQGTSSIWEPWVKEGTTDLGPVYGRQFRRYQGLEWPGYVPTHADLKAQGQHVFHAERAYRHGNGMAATFAHTRGNPNVTYLNDGLYTVDLKTDEVRAVHGHVVEVDQIGQVIADIRAVAANPFNRARRRLIVTLWNPPQIEAMALPPCHTIHTYNMVPSSEDGGKWTLNLHLKPRSIDAFLGLPFNIASYALMLTMVAGVTGCRAGKLLITFDDVHIYDNHYDQAIEQINREPFPAPRLVLPDNMFTEICPNLSIEEAHRLEVGMFKLEGYKSHAKLAGEVAV